MRYQTARACRSGDQGRLKIGTADIQFVVFVRLQLQLLVESRIAVPAPFSPYYIDNHCVTV